jgi:LPXTG-motif cell wall-anchored protein
MKRNTKDFNLKRLLGASLAVAVAASGAIVNPVSASEGETATEYSSVEDENDVAKSDVAENDVAENDVEDDDTEESSVDGNIVEDNDVENNDDDETDIDETDIDDTDTEETEIDESDVAVALAGDVRVAEFKNGVTTCEIKLKDTNDTTGYGRYTDWQDCADYDVDDVVPYKMTATIAEDYEAYSKYKLNFHVTESEVFQFDTKSVKVYLDEINEDNLISSDKYEVITEATKLEDGAKFNVKFDDLKTIEGIKGGSQIIITYNSTLGISEDWLYPVIGYNISYGAYGNPTSLYVEYSNNPNDVKSVAKSSKDRVTVLSYSVVVSKVDGSNKPLEGAEFTLYKKVNGEYVENNDVHNVEPLNFWTNNSTKFVWYGLDDGEYKLVETKTPEGYNNSDDIVFTIMANHGTSSGEPRLNKLMESSNKFTIKAQFDREVYSDGGYVTKHYDAYDGYLTTNVVNTKATDNSGEGDSGTNEDPATPENPATPEDPATPENPVTPENPATPENPVTPEKPATPENPVTPEKPSTTPNTGTTQNPDTTENPETTQTSSSTTTVSSDNSVSEIVTIIDEPVPLATAPIAATPTTDLVAIIDEEVPLASMPSTGDNSKNPTPFAAAGVIAIMAAFFVGKKRKQD